MRRRPKARRHVALKFLPEEHANQRQGSQSSQAGRKSRILTEPFQQLHRSMKSTSPMGEPSSRWKRLIFDLKSLMVVSQSNRVGVTSCRNGKIFSALFASKPLI
jgi:hypothetical protein